MTPKPPARGGRRARPDSSQDLPSRASAAARPPPKLQEGGACGQRKRAADWTRTFAREDMAADGDGSPGALVEERRVHRRVYTDPAIFELEQRRIFGRAWLYVGHESQ